MFYYYIDITGILVFLCIYLCVFESLFFSSLINYVEILSKSQEKFLSRTVFVQICFMQFILPSVSYESPFHHRLAKTTF